MKKNTTNKYDELIENPSSRCACMLVLDCSGSMSGEPIEELNAGIKALLKEIKADDFACYGVDLGIVRFGGNAELMREFGNVQEAKFTELTADGGTPMGEAVNMAIDALEARKNEYKNTGVSYYRPWFILMTDGAPTDNYHTAAARLRNTVQGKNAVVFGVGIGDSCNMSVLNEFCSPERPAVRLRDVNFREFFVWLSASLKQVSSSTPGTQIELPDASGWVINI